MKDELVTFETAKIAKEKGFNEPVPRFYSPTGKLIVNFEDSGSNEREYYFDVESFDETWNEKNLKAEVDGKYVTVCSAPTQSLLQRWLREEHYISTTIQYTVYSGFKFTIVEMNSPPEPDSSIYSNKSFGTYEETLEAGLQEALNLIK